MSQKAVTGRKRRKTVRKSGQVQPRYFFVKGRVTRRGVAGGRTDRKSRRLTTGSEKGDREVR